MNNTILSAEEFLKSKGLYNDKSIKLQNIGMTISEAMIEFTKLHCEAQLKAIIKNVTTKERKKIHKCSSGSEYSYTAVIDKKSIINAYNLNNIK
jgi:hypothetical protein